MAKAHLDKGVQPDLVRFALQLRALTSGRRRPKAAVIPLDGDLEIYAKKDPEFGLQIVKRKKTSQIRSEAVKDRNKIMVACAEWVDNQIVSKKEGGEGVPRSQVRRLFKRCLEAGGPERVSA